jgi:hypothetical protein
VLSESGGWVTVEVVEDTGIWSTVYNLRVAEYHTYFVGTDEWGFSAWAHNADYATKAEAATAYQQWRTANPKTPSEVFFNQTTIQGQSVGTGTIRSVKAIANNDPNWTAPSGMTGPRPKSAPVKDQRQNQAIADITTFLEGELGHTIINGGRKPDLSKYKPEVEIDIPPGGIKETRRADIVAEGPIGPNGERQQYVVNVGPEKANGQPTIEEQRAINDLILALPGRIYYYSYGRRTGR